MHIKGNNDYCWVAKMRWGRGFCGFVTPVLRILPEKSPPFYVRLVRSGMCGGIALEPHVDLEVLAPLQPHARVCTAPLFLGPPCEKCPIRKSDLHTVKASTLALYCRFQIVLTNLPIPFPPLPLPNSPYSYAYSYFW